MQLAHRNTSPSARSGSGIPQMIERATALIRRTQGRIDEDHVPRTTRKDRLEFGGCGSTTVGLMFEETGHEGKVVVDNILFGSPAYMCKQISKGDYIVAVDGMELYSSDAIATALQGSQVPGTTVRINIQRPDTGLVKEVGLQRVATEEIADKRRMFDLFTSIENHAKKEKNGAILQDAEDAFALWTQMLAGENDRFDECEQNLEGLQVDCNGWLEELLSILENIDQDLRAEVKEDTLKESVCISTKSAKLVPDMELAALIDFCESVGSELKQNLSSNIVAAHNKVDHRSKRSKTTIGIMLHGLIIDKMVEGGPAHSSGLLEQGDEILKVDGKEVTEDTFPGIVIGSDAPGSIVTLTVLQASGEGKKDVTLRRMLRESIDDQVTMFELFTNVKEVADGDAEIVAGVDACMKHWTAMSREYQGKEAALMSHMRQLQDTCKLNVDGLNEGLLRMRHFAKDRQEIQELCDDALAGLNSGIHEVVSLGEQVAKTRAHILAKAQLCIRREREVALETAQSEIAAYKRQAEAQRDELVDSQRDMARQLEECRAQQQSESNKMCEMLADVKAKASEVNSMQGELAAKQAETEQLRKDLSGLSKRDAQLEASLVEKQAHINKLLSELKSSAGELGLSQQELRQVQEAQTLLQGQMAHLQDDNSRLNAQVHDASDKNRSLEADLCKANKEYKIALQQLQDGSRSALEKSEMETARLTSEAKKLSEELAAARQEHKKASDAGSKLQETMTALQADVADKDVAISNLKAAVDKSKLGEIAGQQERKALEEEVGKLRSQISQELLPKCANLQSRTDQLAASLQTAETANVTMKRQMDLERAAWVSKQQGLTDSICKAQSDLEYTREELEAARSEKAAASCKLGEEYTAWEEARRGLESQVEALTTELEDRQGQVELVQVQVTEAQRSCRQVQQVYDDSVKKHLEHRNRTLDKLAQRLKRSTIKDEFDSWRTIAHASINERKVAWLEEDQSAKDKEIHDCAETLKALEAEVRDLGAASELCKVVALERARASISRVQEASGAVAAGLVLQLQELQKKADEAESNLALHVKRAAHEHMTSQAEQERLSSKMEAILAEKASMKHDFATMMDELTEYRAKLGERGVKMSPRIQRSFRESFRSSASLPSESDDDDKARLQAEQKYTAKSGGKYFMC